MSWIRTAVSRAVEVGGNNNLRRTVWSVADSVVQHAGSAVFGGARMIHNRIAARNMQNLRITVKRLEEVSVSCKGVERIQLLRRWLVALKEIDRLLNDQKNNNDDNKNISITINNSDTTNDNDKNNVDQFSFEDIKDSPQKPSLVYYYDPEVGEPMNFREVFLYSQALEGMTLSMILEVPNEEEVSLFMEILRLCIAGGKEVHETVMSNIMNLAVAFSSYVEEVLVKREELLQYAQAAIKGLKINVGLARIDAEACSLKEKLGEMKALQNSSTQGHEDFFQKQTTAMIEALKEALGLVRLYSRLEALLLKKKTLSNGDTPQVHAEKVDKLKVLSESLSNSTSKAEKRILEQRVQKEEAVSFRIAKANEVSQQEKELEAAIQELEKQKDELEAELKKVNASLIAARVRLRNAREEREHFDDASNQILLQLTSKEEEISRSIASCRVEADVVNAWIHFLEDTWFLQTTFHEQKEKQVNGELERYGEYFVNLVSHLLSAYKEQLRPSISRIRQLVESLSSSERSGETAKDESQKAPNQRRNLEEEYLNLESKFVSTFSVVGSMKTQIYSPNEGTYRKKDERLKELFDDLESIREEFESMERPTLELENPILNSHSPSIPKSQKSPWSRLKSSLNKKDQKKLKFELEQDEDEESLDYETDEIVEWEYDAFEKDLKPTN
ncbi:RING finger protein isoform X2 [Gossypium australe]|uniref:RING finger protein isoform X2 n=1 Tax=Gossypium australe TaxID=47621 RepID=A0A5B6WZZ7_9ROSI|nr:RING finger protein isoform X2 [Gossypium australe]